MPTLITDKLIHPAAWTLSYEFAFYGMFLLFGLLAHILARRTSFILTLLPGLAMIAYHPRAACFLIGLGIALEAQRHLRTSHERPRRLFIESGLSILLAMLALHACYMEIDDLSGDLWSITHSLKASVLFVASLVLSYAGLRDVFNGYGGFARLLDTRALQFLGSISYSLYLWQTVVMAIMKKLFYMAGAPELLGPWSQLMLLIVVLPPTLIVSYASQRTLEVGVTNWLRRRSHRTSAMHQA